MYCIHTNNNISHNPYIRRNSAHPPLKFSQVLEGRPLNSKGTNFLPLISALRRYTRVYVNSMRTRRTLDYPIDPFRIRPLRIFQVCISRDFIALNRSPLVSSYYIEERRGRAHLAFRE